MALFEKTDPALQAQKDAESGLRSKRRDRDNLNEKLGVTEAAIVSYRAQARQLAAEGADDKAISIAESKMRDAQDRKVTLSGAIDDVSKTIAELEAQIEAIVDKRFRSETGAAVGVMAARLEKAQAAFNAAAIELEAAAREAALIILDGHPVAAFVMEAKQQLPPAVEAITVGLRNHARAVLSGHAPASLPRPAPPPVELRVVPSEPMVNVFVLRNLKYQNKAGVVVCIGANKRHDLPKALAELALDTRVALPLSEKQKIRDLGYGAVSYEPDPAACAWLGPVGRESPARSMRPGPPVTHSSLTTFEVMDRGPARTVTVPRGPEPDAMPLAVGARKAEEE